MQKQLKTIYIAGPIRGRNLDDVRQTFKKKEAELIKEGYRLVINPVRTIDIVNQARQDMGERQLTEEEDRATILRYGIRALIDCHVLYLLPDWRTSDGAILEKRIAQELGMEIIEDGH